MVHYVTAIFHDGERAERAVRGLIDRHFDPDEISVVVADARGVHDEAVEHDTGVAEGAVSGAAIGGTLGALGATLVATGIVAGPGVGLLAAGPILAALKGAVAGAAAGLEIGALAGLGFWKDEAHVPHTEALVQGSVVIAVPAAHRHADQARKLLGEAGADEVFG
jgi:hypothetical protein